MNNVSIDELSIVALRKRYSKQEKILRGAYAVAENSKADAVLKYLTDNELDAPPPLIRITTEVLPEPTPQAAVENNLNTENGKERGH